MSNLILGLGVGSFILITLWLLAFILCLISIRTKKIIGIIAILTAALITTILLLIPRRFPGEKKDDQESDYSSIWHNLLASFLGLCSLGGVIIYLTSVNPIQPYKIRTWVQ